MGIFRPRTGGREAVEERRISVVSVVSEKGKKSPLDV